jgi:hypothetical protein
MVKAVVKNGVIVPRDPLPADWREGTEVEVEKPSDPIKVGDELDRWYAELETLDFLAEQDRRRAGRRAGGQAN